MEHLLMLFASVTAQYNLPPGLLMSICTVESGLNVRAIHKDDGSDDSRGICQLHLNTARLMGFKGPESQLLEAGPNILFSGRYLAHQLHRYNGDYASGIAAYNSGTLRLDHCGKIRNIKYVNKVTKAWRSGS